MELIQTAYGGQYFIYFRKDSIFGDEGRQCMFSMGVESAKKSLQPVIA